MSNQKTETKLALSPNGQVVKTEVPVIDMPETISEVNFEVEDDLMLGDYIPVSEKTKSGIIIPESVQKDKSLKAILIAVGKNLSERYTVGDIVIFRGTPPITELEGKKILTLERFHIVGRYKK